MNKRRKYVISKSVDKFGQAFWYCHLEGFPYVPVMGSIGSKQKATSMCKLMNQGRAHG